ncbi:hypothetical protein HYW17_03800 [Candidatus Uhrbacteria bacterium]|nr:hypothetical protein [Candidatus Uhrbacteria bacterium]
MSDQNKANVFPTFGATRRVVRGGFANFFGEAIRALEHIILVPLFLFAWSGAIYGEWLIVFSGVAYLVFADIGMTNFVINRMLQRYAVGDTDGYKRTLWSAWYLYRLNIGALFFIFFGFAFFAPFTQWFHFTHVSEASVRIAIFLLGLQLLLSRLMVLFSGIYIGTGEYPRWRMLLNIREIATLALVGIVLLFKGGFITVAGAYLSVFVAFAALLYLDILRRHPEVEFRGTIKYRDKKLARSFLVPGFMFLLIPLAQFIKMQGSVLLAGSIFGGAIVALFSIHRTLAHLIPRAISIMTPALQHEVTANLERGDLRKVQDIYNIFMKIVVAVSISSAAFLLVVGKDVLAVWTGGAIGFNNLLWGLLLAEVVVYSVVDASARFQIAVNQYRWYAIVRVFSAIIGWILAAYFVRRFGIAGIVVGFLIPEALVDLTVIPYMTLRLIKEPMRRFVGMLGVGAMFAGLQFTVVELIGRLEINWALRLGITFAAAAIIGLLGTYLIWFRPHERRVFLAVCKLPLVRFKRIFSGRSE